MTAPSLTPADIRALTALFTVAYLKGRMRTEDHEKTVVVLAAARELVLGGVR